MHIKSIKYKQGRYQKQVNGSVKLVAQTSYIGLLGVDNTIVGFTYKVESPSTQKIKIRNEYIYPNGTLKTSESSIETNMLLANILTVHTIEEDILGKMVFRIVFPEHPELETLEQTFYIFDQYKGVLFQKKSFYPAKDNDIYDFEQKYDVLLCEDYKHFIKTYNGLYIYWWQYATNLDKSKGAYQSDKHGIMQTHYPFNEDLGKRYKEWDWIYDAKTLFGLGNKNPYLDMKYFYMQNLFCHDNLVKYAYPIGQDGGGNCIMQIAKGKYRGKLAMLDHETSGAMIDWIKGKTEDVYKIPPEKANVDDFLEDCFTYGGLTLYDIYFKEYVVELMQKHKKLYEEIYEVYKK